MTKTTWKRRDTRLRLEQFARHPKCPANVASAVLGIPMHVVADAERPGAGTFGQSPFALALGVTFERSLFSKSAERLRTELAEAGVLPSPAADFLDLRLKMNGGPMKSLDAAAAETVQLLRRLGDGAALPSLPLIVAGAALELPGEPVLLPEAMLALDALVVRATEDGIEVVVGEVKTYPDRAGFTDRAQLATARAQAGVYSHALDVAIDTLGLRGRVRVSPVGFLVLARPGTTFPKVRAGEELRYQARRADRGFSQLREATRQLSKDFAEPPSDLEVEVVQAADTCYRATCVSFCERAEQCHELAFHSGDPAVLGEEASRFLGDVHLDRASALLGGAKATTASERSFLERAHALEQVSP